MSKFFSNYRTLGTSSRPELDLSDHWVGYVRSTKQVIYSPKVDVDSNGHSYVDLGLPSGTLWATQNIGSSSETGYGDYFAWGEISTKSTFTWNNYAWGTEDHPTKYNSSDGMTSLEPEDDAAHVLWGGNWVVPSINHWQELIDNAQASNVVSGVKGVRFTGQNGNSIFLPAAYIYNNYYSCYYWTSNLDSSGSYYDGASVFNSSSITNSTVNVSTSSRSRYVGFVIRPVLNAQRRFLSHGGPSEPWNVPQ